MHLTGKVAFKRPLRGCNKVQVPKLIRWLFKLEPEHALGVLNLAKHKEFLDSKYSKVYSTLLLTYSIRYHEFYGNLSLLETIPSTVRNNALKSLVALSKYKGEYSEFHKELKH